LEGAVVVVNHAYVTAAAEHVPEERLHLDDGYQGSSHRRDRKK